MGRAGNPSMHLACAMQVGFGDVNIIVSHSCSKLSHISTEMNTHTIVLLLFWNLSGTTRMSGFTGARDSEWQWHLLGHMQVCTSFQITTPTSHHSVFYRPDALPVAQPTVSKH